MSSDNRLPKNIDSGGTNMEIGDTVRNKASTITDDGFELIDNKNWNRKVPQLENEINQENI